MNSSNNNVHPINRRSFLKSSLAAWATIQVVPSFVARAHGETAPSRKLNIAGIGVGGMGRNNLKRCADTENFDYDGPLSEMVLMGNLAVRFPNRCLVWDGEKVEVTNDKEANAYVKREYRIGWSL